VTSAFHDRAAVTTTALFQIDKTAPQGERRRAYEAYLRDDYAAHAQEVLAANSVGISGPSDN